MKQFLKDHLPFYLTLVGIYGSMLALMLAFPAWPKALVALWQIILDRPAAVFASTICIIFACALLFFFAMFFAEDAIRRFTDKWFRK